MSTDNTGSGSGAPPSGGPDPLVGKEIDGCTIVRKIGQGGMGIVYLAEHSKLRQQYVVKILNPALTAAEDTIQRFFREAQSVARLNHPSIVGIQNVGQEGDYYYIRMEYVDGDTVENIVKEQKKLDWKLATRIILETAEALSHAHKKGTIHRDIKPENIMLTKNGEVKVMDFGLAKQVQAATKVSVTGQIVGTPFFMSPEQAGGKTVDARSDIYSLGVSYYYLLTGVKPFNGKNLQEIFLKHFFYTPESPKIYAPDLPENVCELIRRCLKKKKKERYQSAAQLAKDLHAVLEGGELSAPEGGAEASDGVPSSPSSSDITSPGSSNPDAGRTTRGFVGSSSDPAMPVGGDTVSRDLVAAQAEIGAGDPGTIVASGQSPSGNGSATVIAKAVGDAPGEDAATAPLQKRGNRVSLTTQSAGASLVFQPGKAPGTFQPGPQQTGNTATAAPPAAASDPDMKKLAAATIPSMAGPVVAGAKADPKKAPPTKPATAKSSRQKKLTIAIVAGIVVMVAGTYEALGMMQFSSLDQDYTRMMAVHPSEADESSWATLKKDWDDLAESYEKFGTTFKLTPSAAEAASRADKCREGSKTAETTRAAAVQKKADEEKNLKDQFKKRQETEAKRKARDGLLDQIKALVAQKKYDDAAKVAADAYPIAKALNERVGDVRVPVEVTCDLASKVYLAGSNEELGSVTPPVPAIVMVPYSDRPIKIEVRKPKFQTWTSESSVTTFLHLHPVLDREIKSRFKLGLTDEMVRFKNSKFQEPLVVRAAMGVDTQDPSLDVVCQDGTLRSFDSRTGRARWRQTLGLYGDNLTAPDVLPGKAIVSSTPEGLVVAHDVPTGSTVCQARVGAPLVATPRIDPSARYIVAGTLTGDVVCLDTQNAPNRVATEKWRLHTEATILTTPMIQGNRVIVGSLDDRLRVIDIDTGRLLAVYDAREAICAGPTAFGDTVYIGTREGRVHAIQISNNYVVTPVFQTAPAGSEILQIIATAKGIFYSTKNDVRSTDNAGNRIFQPFTPSSEGVPYEVSGFVPMNDSIAVVTLNGWVFSVDAKSGQENWKLSLGSAIHVPPVFDGDLHIATEDGEILAIGGD